MMMAVRHLADVPVQPYKAFFSLIYSPPAIYREQIDWSALFFFFLVFFLLVFLLLVLEDQKSMSKSHEILMFVSKSVVDQHNEYNQTLWHHSIVYHLFGDKQTSKSHET